MYVSLFIVSLEISRTNELVETYPLESVLRTNEYLLNLTAVSLLTVVDINDPVVIILSPAN